MALEIVLNPEQIPERIKTLAPWLNDDYIRRYGWVPDKNTNIEEWYETCLRLGITCKESYEIIRFEETCWGVRGFFLLGT